MKLLLVAGSILFLLCGPAAFAAPAPAPTTPTTPTPPTPPPTPTPPVHVELTVSDGATTRTHELVLPEEGCGSVREKATNRDDKIRICLVRLAGRPKVDIQWYLRVGAKEYETTSITDFARGARFELGRRGAAQLTVVTR